MTGFEHILLFLKSTAFVKIVIILLTILVNTMLVDKPRPGIIGFIRDFGRQTIFVLFVFLVISPVGTPVLAGILGSLSILGGVPIEAINQLAFGIILIGSRDLIVRAKIYLNKLKIKNVK